MSDRPSPDAPIPRQVRFILVVVWAVAVGLLFRNDSPYRYAEVHQDYPWRGVAKQIAVMTVEAILSYHLARWRARKAPRRTGVWLSAALFVCFILNSEMAGFDSPAWAWAAGHFALFGMLAFIGYGIYLGRRFPRE